MPNIYFATHRYQRSSNGPTICPWNVGLLHCRKLITSDGAMVVGADNVAYPDCKINFVGEWECCSEYENNPAYMAGAGMLDIFENIHHPFFTPLDSAPAVINTDPFVWGDHFYYACCKLRRSMREGDLVLFGRYNPGVPDDLMIDTVMVLDKPTNDFPQGYINVTACKMDTSKPIWQGQMYTENTDLFSFVPCRQDAMTSLPVVGVSFGGSVLKATRNGSHITVPSAADVQAIFDDIISQMRAQGFELGVYMPLPDDVNDLTTIVR